jgi:hypothetical protein
MLWRSARKQLTRQQELIAREHFDRLLESWAGNITQSRRARLWANARCLALHPERLTSGYGWHLRRIKAARHAHATIRTSGRVPGQEARAALAAKREREANVGKQWRYGNVLEN